MPRSSHASLEMKAVELGIIMLDEARTLAAHGHKGTFPQWVYARARRSSDSFSLWAADNVAMVAGCEWYAAPLIGQEPAKGSDSGEEKGKTTAWPTCPCCSIGTVEARQGKVKPYLKFSCPACGALCYNGLLPGVHEHLGDTKVHFRTCGCGSCKLALVRAMVWERMGQ